MPVVAGVDGCRGRWLTVRRSVGSGLVMAELLDDLGPLIDDLRSGELDAVAIDMPIGLLESHPRTCDVAARRLLGPRRSSVFPAPVRATLMAEDYDDARRRSRQAARTAPSKQAFNLLPSIRHLDPLVGPEDQDRLVEGHPELAFARLHGHPLPEPKKTPEGQRFRQQLLLDTEPELGPVLDDLVSRSDDRHPLPLIDLLDALALTHTADHVAKGTERRLPDPAVTSDSQRDRFGRRAEIVW